MPHYALQEDWDEIYEKQVKGQERLQNAYWYLHNRMNSKAKVHYGDVYKLPVELGIFDVVFMGMILGHLRDHFQAIYSASRLCRSRIVITNQSDAKTRWWRKKKRPPTARFMPAKDRVLRAGWWPLSIECISRMLGTLGFNVVETIGSQPKCLIESRLGTENCVTIVAERLPVNPKDWSRCNLKQRDQRRLWVTRLLLLR